MERAWRSSRSRGGRNTRGYAWVRQAGPSPAGGRLFSHPRVSYLHPRYGSATDRSLRSWRVMAGGPPGGVGGLGFFGTFPLSSAEALAAGGPPHPPPTQPPPPHR